MSMYNLAEIILVFVIFLLGIFMFLKPVQATKEENRSDENAVAKTKKNGLILMIISGIAIVLLVVGTFLLP